MKTRILLLLIIAAGVAVIECAPGARASANSGVMYGVCVTVTGLSQYTCSCFGQQGTLSRTTITTSPACGTKRVFWVTPDCDAGPGGCRDIDDRQENCEISACNSLWDGDTDGWGPACCGGADCDDSDPSAHPFAPPYCLGCPNPACIYDKNCNGLSDYDDCGPQECSNCSYDNFCESNCYPYASCSGGTCIDPTPIVIDVQGNGFNLTNTSSGVTFDLSGDGSAERIGWTAPNSDDAWLVLDRNGNGKIDNGPELFGNMTAEKKENGFLALAEYDKASKGGNGDGQIDQRDQVFSSLRLWQDSNHNGVTEAGELHTLPELGVAALELDYKESKRTDEHGNKFRYRAKVKDSRGAQVGRWAWDVIPVLVKQ